MATLDQYRKIIHTVLREHVQIPYLNKAITKEMIIDEKNDRYLVVSLGWDHERRVHGCLIHLEIIEGKIWIQKDNTDSAIARELEKAGIPKNQIVLGFYDSSVRQHTEYAFA